MSGNWRLIGPGTPLVPLAELPGRRGHFFPFR